MRNLWASIFLFLLNFGLVRSGFNVKTVHAAKSKLQLMFPGHSIPDGMPEWIAVLEDSIHIHSCLPTIKEGRCYKSRTCRLPELKFDGQMLPFVLKFCKDPYEVGIHFVRYRLQWWAKMKLHPIIIRFNHNDRDGVLTVRSRTTWKKRVRWISYGTHKVTFSIDGVLRYDCTKPKGKHNTRTRVEWNRKAPGKQYGSHYYKLKIRIEVKKKRFNWFRFNYKCKRCEDVVNEVGTIGVGPRSCAAEVHKWIKKSQRPPHYCEPYYLTGPPVGTPGWPSECYKYYVK